MKKLLSVILAAVLLLSIMPFTVFAEGEVEEYFFNGEYTLTSSANNYREYSVVPPQDGWYVFRSFSDEWNTRAILYNSDGDELAKDGFEYSGYNFNFKYYLYADNTYYLKVGQFNPEALRGSFEFIVGLVDADEVSETVPPTNPGNSEPTNPTTIDVDKVVISKPPVKRTCIEGIERETIDLSDLEATFTLSSGEEILWAYDKDIGNEIHHAVTFNVDSDDKGNYFVYVQCGRGYDRFYFDTIKMPDNAIKVSYANICDIDGDETISIMDASVVQRNVAKLDALESLAHHKTAIKSQYATTVQHYLAKIIS